MRQVWSSKRGRPAVLSLREGPDPVPGNGEVRIRVQAVGVTFTDLLARLGLYPDAPGPPFVPGFEVAGVVDLLSQGVPNLREGDAVLALTNFGGYSDSVCVPYRQVFPRFDWMPAVDGAAIPMNYLTAYQALVVTGAIRAGDKVLIHNAGGGVGQAALDICRILGAETIGTASPEKQAILEAKGCRYFVDYRNRDYEQVIADITGGKGVQLIIDPLGGRHWPKNYRLLAPAGRLVHVGMSSVVSGPRRSFLRLVRELIMLPFYNPIQLINANKSVGGVHIGHLWGRMDLVRAWMEQLLRWYDEALFRPEIDRTFPLLEAAEAHQYLHDRRNAGKVILIP
jgi:NADPH:quinone reductase-like Zn-dependent oxidoreductase